MDRKRFLKAVSILGGMPVIMNKMGTSTSTKVSSPLSTNGEWALSDFGLDLNAILHPEDYLWVGSGQVTVQPQDHKALGVGGWNAPPFRGEDFSADLVLHLNGHEVREGHHLYGGLLNQGGTWLPHKIMREGTYVGDVDGQRISVGLQSELVPLFGTSGFLLKIDIKNRGKQTVKVNMTPEVTPGHPIYQPLDKWDYFPPEKAKQEAKPVSERVWQNDQVRIRMHTGALKDELETGETMTTYLAFTFCSPSEDGASIDSVPKLLKQSENAWQDRLSVADRRIPRLTSNIPGLQDYYKRSVATGLACIWEHPDYSTKPWLATGGINGASMSSFLWDFGGYAPALSTMMLGDSMKTIARKFASMGLMDNNRIRPAGNGVGPHYAYNIWCFVSLVWEIFRHLGPDEALYREAQTLVSSAEQAYPSHQGLKVFGGKWNMIELLNPGWEQIVVSPNAERAWNFDRLADMAELVGDDEADTAQWRAKAETIRQAVRDELWDEEAQWFINKSAEGLYLDTTYSIQVFDAIRAGAGNEAIKKAVFSHLEPGKFLGAYGVTSISREDRIHYNLDDTDFGGGGAYVGDGPQLALTLYEDGRPALAWDVLQRFFWMGKHLPYYSQAQMADRPSVSARYRPIVIAGLAGAEAVLYGLIGIDPQPDGSLWVDPQLPPDLSSGAYLRVEGLGFRGHSVDIQLESNSCTILLDEQTVYNGVIKRIKVI